MYLLRGIISIPAPVFKRGWHFVARFLHFCCRWHKKRAARRGFARSGALGLPGAGHVVAACLGVDLSKTEWCFVRWLQFGQNLEELAHGVSPGHADFLVLEYEEIAIPRPGLFLPRSAQVQFGQCLLICQMVALGLDDDYLPGARSHDKIRIVVNKAIDGETRSRDITVPPPSK